MEFVVPAPSVTARIGWVIPSAVVHGCPTHELGARVVTIAVVVEEVRYSEAAEQGGEAFHRPGASELVFLTLERFAL